jgi:hypothetical protein
MDELAIVQPHGPERIVAATTRRRTSALVAIVGRVNPADAGALGVLVRDGGMLTVVASGPEAAVPIRSRRIRPLLVASDADHPFPTAWNEAVLRWQRSGRHPLSASHARS